MPQGLCLSLWARLPPPHLPAAPERGLAPSESCQPGWGGTSRRVKRTAAPPSLPSKLQAPRQPGRGGRGSPPRWKRKARGPRDCPSLCGEQPQPHVLGDWPSRPSLNQMQGCPAQDTNMLKRNKHLPLAGEFLPTRQEAHGPQMVVTVRTSQASAHRVAGSCGLQAGVRIPHAPP